MQEVVDTVMNIHVKALVLWSAKTSDDKFYSAGCNRSKDYIITNGGPVVTFRSDNIVWEFRDLSIREIQPLQSTN